MLTSKQHALLYFIRDYYDCYGIAPSFNEMMHGMNLKSKSGVHRLLKNLEERGFIRWLHGRARAVEIIKMPERAKTRTNLDAYTDMEILQEAHNRGLILLTVA